ncbi:enoyl-CoA hydratase/isomerase family protein [Streptomyces lunaelactis]|uniref:enoyl-CoA hydratase/isomerase family protein n=1 Tax=Streptomyces lunaelactis TaxID=1535768 RepID=UPI00158552EA|nr:enoyl-CoA hydratase/isomerase family protein [Streptomyces lunaelactis]NUK10085.1 enoyl-CoA hydratase/isomerase family protein [Streptomyces lunaelactis]NUK21335.1 enoyl-CoA hydratase/isomerase family protein [Streptomyces lunaelactis]NUK52509.1 enoyl-CoA hydratase/isomerase family protein [Streptomyces lunaelactis]NUK66819.1 enoyl-CoA hydratase/isomerase family protein [Streptomyces lunaelactis]NUL11977.1 enoyl-CoA hydratase/isomerase family protein [Streptomyces lunaelactis]
MEPKLHHSVVDGVATVVISNPDKRNAMTAGMWRALPELLGQLAADDAVRALVLTGEGSTFCAGADISSLREPGEAPQSLAVRAEQALAAFPKPTLAAVRGYCVGGGCQLAAACDLRFAEEDALFGVTPAKLGIVYPASSTRRLVALVGPAAAKYLLFSGELIGTERALRTGLVDEVLPAGELGKRVAEFTRIVASRSQLTQAAAKEFATGRTDRDAHWEEQQRGSGDPAEGVAAFLERRVPRFTWSTTSG